MPPTGSRCWPTTPTALCAAAARSSSTRPAGWPSGQNPELWALAVGVSDYIGDKIDLQFAAKDAEAFSQALAVAADRLLGKERVHIRTLSTDRPGAGDRPTRASIEAAFKQIASHAQPTDLLVVYLSGHGAAPQGSDEYYYLTADARSLEFDDPAVRRRDALSGYELAELIRAVPATGKQVLILDTCAAGQGIKALGQRRDVPFDQVRALERMKDRNGLHLLAGSAADASSYEASRYGQGLLTYSLLLGMKGPGLKGTELDVLTWFGYAVDEVPGAARVGSAGCSGRCCRAREREPASRWAGWKRRTETRSHCPRLDPSSCEPRSRRRSCSRTCWAWPGGWTSCCGRRRRRGTVWRQCSWTRARVRERTSWRVAIGSRATRWR